MKRLLLCGLVALALVLLGASAAGASTPGAAVTKQDTASTKAFVALQERNDIASIHAAAAVNAALDAVVAQARSGCADVLKNAPKKADKHQFGPILQFFTEAVLALSVGQLTPVRGLSESIGDQQQHLRFSDPALQWQVRVDGSALSAYVKLRPPDLCADARVLAASHFTKSTAAGTRFVSDATTLFALAAAPSSPLLRRMRPYAPVAVAAGLKRLPQLQHTLDQKLGFDRHFRALVRALGDTHLMTNSARAGVTS